MQKKLTVAALQSTTPSSSARGFFCRLASGIAAVAAGSSFETMSSGATISSVTTSASIALDPKDVRQAGIDSFASEERLEGVLPPFANDLRLELAMSCCKLRRAGDSRDSAAEGRRRAATMSAAETDVLLFALVSVWSLAGR